MRAAAALGTADPGGGPHRCPGDQRVLTTLRRPRRDLPPLLKRGHRPSGMSPQDVGRASPLVRRCSRRNAPEDPRCRRDVDVVVIGAGQAGLSTAWALARQGFEPETGFVVLDADAGPGGAWQHRWPSLTVGSTHRVHDLPGLPFEPDTESRRAAEVVPAYFAEYERRFELPVHRPVRVRAVRRTDDGRFRGRDRRRRLDRPRDRQRDRHLDPPLRPPVSGPGTLPRPPAAHRRLPRRRRVRRAARRRGRRRGVGDPAARRDLPGRLNDLGDPPAAGGATARSTRTSGGRRRPGRGGGARGPSSRQRRRRDRPADVDAVHPRRPRPWVLERLPMFDRITADGVAWTPGRGAARACRRHPLGHRLPRRPEPPGAAAPARSRRRHPDGRHPRRREPRIHLVGYGPSASTIGANRAGQSAARQLRRLLRRRGSRA